MAIAGTSLEIILSGTTAAISAQVFKCIFYYLTKRPVNFRTLVQTGGMPSSHSSTVASVATSVGLIDGFHSTIFAVAFGLAMIVMYDAAGLRQAAGRMAGILNKITEDIYSDHPEHVPTRLRELLGHTPVEVFVGAFLGIMTAYVYHVKLVA